MEKVKTTVQRSLSVTELKPMMTLETRDLDSVTENDERESTIGKLLDNSGGEVRIRMTTPNSACRC